MSVTPSAMPTASAIAAAAITAKLNILDAVKQVQYAACYLLYVIYICCNGVLEFDLESADVYNQ